MTDFAVLRQRMVDNQLRTSEVTDPDVVGAFLSIAREAFVAEEDRPFAYTDRELKMSATRRMLDPVTLGRLVHALPRGPNVKAMVIGAGTGYSAALLGATTGSVVAVEEDEGLARRAAILLREAGADNVGLVQGRLVEGRASEGPYDAILVDGAVEVLPEALVGQLRPNGLLATIERDGRVSRAVVCERVGDSATRWPQFDAWAPLLPGFERKREFVF